MKVKVEIEKTLQVRQFEPLRVSISAEDDVEDPSGITEMYRDISKKLHTFLMREYQKYDALGNSAPEANKAKPATPPRLKKSVKSKVVQAEY